MALHDITLTRGALYILEGVLQDMGPCTTPAKVVAVAKLYSKVRKANDRTLTLGGASFDIEKGLLRAEGETDIAWTARQQAWNAAFAAWSEAPVAITLNDKQRDVAKAHVTWVVNGQKKEAKTKLAMSENLGLLLDALGLGDDDTPE